MSWARMDDRYDDHEKVKCAWKLSGHAAALHAHAITYSARHETDGIITAGWIQERFDIARLKSKERETAMSALVTCGLLDSIDGERFQVHDYLDYNPSRESLDEKRRKDSERKARGRSGGVRTESNGNPNGVHTESNGNPNGPSRAFPQASPAALPVPSLPNPLRD